MDAQRGVTTFVQDNDLDAPPTYRLLDLVSEVGEVAKDAAESTGYGRSPDRLDVSSEEIGDVLFSLLALAVAAGIDAEEALEKALAKYERRLDERDSPSSGA